MTFQSLQMRGFVKSYKEKQSENPNKEISTVSQKNEAEVKEAEVKEAEVKEAEVKEAEVKEAEVKRQKSKRQKSKRQKSKITECIKKKMKLDPFADV